MNYKLWSNGCWERERSFYRKLRALWRIGWEITDEIVDEVKKKKENSIHHMMWFSWLQLWLSLMMAQIYLWSALLDGRAHGGPLTCGIDPRILEWTMPGTVFARALTRYLRVVTFQKRNIFSWQRSLHIRFLSQLMRYSAAAIWSTWSQRMLSGIRIFASVPKSWILSEE